MPISAVDTISLAVQHTKRQLLQPFRIGQWTRLAIVGLLAGELGSGGNFNFTKRINAAGSAPGHAPWGQILPKIDPAILASVITVLVVSLIVFLIVMTYISSVMRFVLFDSVLTRECHIRAGWNRRQDIAWKLFLWQLAVIVCTFVATALFIGLPALYAFQMGWFKNPRAHIAQLVFGGLIVLILFLALVIAIALVHVLTKDFVVPQMALEGIGAVEGWRRLLPWLRVETKDYVLYIVMKIVLAIGAGIVVGVVTIILALLIAIPVIGIIVAAAVAAKTAALTWNVFTVTAAVVAGFVLFLIFFYLVSLVSVPVIVFFPAYSIYFFAARYRALSVALYPPPPAPPIAPVPQPAG